MTTIKIDKNVPLPGPLRGIQTGLTAELRKMEIGDSAFLVRHRPFQTTLLSRRTGFSFTQRKVTEGGKAGYRIWRIK